MPTQVVLSFGSTGIKQVCETVMVYCRCVGTHEYSKFVRPEELESALASIGMCVCMGWGGGKDWLALDTNERFPPLAKACTFATFNSAQAYL